MRSFPLKKKSGLESPTPTRMSGNQGDAGGGLLLLVFIVVRLREVHPPFSSLSLGFPNVDGRHLRYFKYVIVSVT